MIYDKFMQENQDRVMKEVKLAKMAAQKKKEEATKYSNPFTSLGIGNLRGADNQGADEP